jgi:hypothetical protein
VIGVNNTPGSLYDPELRHRARAFWNWFGREGALITGWLGESRVYDSARRREERDDFEHVRNIR